jgi:hypothetical protein
VYDPATSTVTLFPVERLDIHNRYQLTVNGMAPNGLTDPGGQFLDGKGNGKPGSDFVTVISRATLAGPAPTALKAVQKKEVVSKKHTELVSAPAVDKLAASNLLAVKSTRVPSSRGGGH